MSRLVTKRLPHLPGDKIEQFTIIHGAKSQRAVDPLTTSQLPCKEGRAAKIYRILSHSNDFFRNVRADFSD
jgi:hypothetical protein